jgi:2'-5' RNA ligase
MQPGDIFVGVFVDKHAVGMKFTQWPLHVTLVSWSRPGGDSNLSTLRSQLKKKLRETKPFTAITSNEEWLAGGKVLVNLVTPKEEFEGLYDAIKQTEILAGFRFVSTLHPSYVPHVTVQPSERLHEGDEFTADRLYIIEQKGEYKEVVGEVCFGE